MRTRFVTFADNAVAVEYDDADHVDLLDRLFADLGDEQNDAPTSRFRLRGSRGKARLDQDGRCVFSGSDQAELARLLLENALESLVDNDHSGLALHAAAVRAGPFGVLIPGESGAGKSTLSAWLASRGYGYLTDELVHIDLGTKRIEAFTRPFSLKRNGLQLLEQELGIDVSGDAVLHTKDLSIVPHRLFNPVHESAAPDLGVILFPMRTSKPTHRLEPLSRGQAALKLVECLVNGRNIAHHGIDQLSRIAREVPAYVLHYSGFRSLPGLVERVLPDPAGVVWPDPRCRDAAG